MRNRFSSEIAISCVDAVRLQAGHTVAEDVTIACAQAVQSAVAGCDASQQAHICQIACNHLDQYCRQLPQHSAAPQPASNSSNSLDACTGLQENRSSRQLVMPHANEQLDSTAAAPENGVPNPNSSSTANRVHSEGEVSRLLAHGAVVSAAAVAAMRPHVLPHDRAKPSLECLVQLAMQLPEGRSQEACMVAAAAIINKWPPGGFRRVCIANTYSTVFAHLCATVTYTAIHASQVLLSILLVHALQDLAVVMQYCMYCTVRYVL